MTSKSQKLTKKQELFVQNYLANGCNGVQAAKSAGYKGSDNTLASVAKENLRKPHIAEKIEAEQNKLKEDLHITAEWKREKLREVIERCLQAEPVMIKVEGEWTETGEYQFDGKTAVGAIAELNKMDGDLAAIKIRSKNEHVFVDHVEKLQKARERAKNRD
ncbi:terminase small subunit [Aliikangiella coralliicola]|uniref:Terminase small subunit n=1 Tax=Aliikangiella coralliicola TaxID=2592383 RepID=A0A545U062_9GAMM|nr:terminase small subunit [Aliikangiella coralliicola]TQV82850.1 hypothetical protein FLL46_24075 [Aliikangiella coralliicola]